MYDIVFISYRELNADENFLLLKERFPTIKRINGVKGIHNAHVKAASIALTKMLWIVDADATLMDDFNFSYKPDIYNEDTVHVWRSKNPINDLVYGYGGVKLFPRLATLNMNTCTKDMTTSISNKFKAMPEISNVTSFNTDPFNTWRSAFRECAKLSSKVIDRQKDNETNERLKIWTTIGEDRPYGKYAIKGARAGMAFGLDINSDLKLINDFDWLKEKFDANI
jgi:hypothetical protein